MICPPSFRYSELLVPSTSLFKCATIFSFTSPETFRTLMSSFSAYGKYDIILDQMPNLVCRTLLSRINRSTSTHFDFSIVMIQVFPNKTMSLITSKTILKV